MAQRGAAGLAWLLLASLGACDLATREVGTVELADLELESCPDLPRQLSCHFAVFSDCSDILFLRLQVEGTPMTAADGLALQIPNLSELVEGLAASPVTLRAEDGGFRATVFLLDSCPGSFESLEALAGELTVEELDLVVGGRLRLHGTFDLTDLRTGEEVASGVALDLDTGESSVYPKNDYVICP